MRQGPSLHFQHHHRRGITLLEVLASLAIISVMLATLIPAVSATRGEARLSQCLSNLKMIAATAGMYSADHASSSLGGRPTQPWWISVGGYTPSWLTEFIYGGFQHEESPEFPGADTAVIPTELRPFNKYIVPGISGKTPLRQYICPGDSSNVTWWAGGPGEPPSVGSVSTWEVFGNSYAINWYWVEGAPSGAGYYPLDKIHRYGSAMLNKKVGAAASKFVLFMEASMNAYMYDARPPDGSHGESQLQTLGMGWHGRHSTYSMAMWDGHVEYRFIDTRYTSDYGYELWPEPATLWPPS